MKSTEGYFMICTRKEFGIQLKQRVLQNHTPSKIAAWAYEVYIDYPDIKDSAFLKLVMKLVTMEMGEQFEFSNEELLQIAEDFIAEKEIKT